MKDSGIAWIGEIPEEWEVKKLKYITYCNKNTLQESTDAETIINYIDISSVSELYGIIETQEFNFHDAPSRARRIVHCGDVIISTVRTYLRAVSYIEKIYDNYICSTGFAVLTPIVQELLSKFMYYTLFSDFFVSTVEKLSVGIGYPAITAENLHSIKIPLPPLPEQHRIADYLDAKCTEIDRSMELARQGIDKLKAYRMSVITEAVTKGLDPDVPMKDSGVPWIGEIPEGWLIQRMKNIATIARGGSPRPIEDYLTDDDGGLNWIKIGDTIKGHKFIDKVQQKIRIDGLSKTRFVHKGDLILTNSMSFGEPYILNIDGCIHDGWVCFQNVKINIIFLYYLLCSQLCIEQFILLTSGGVVQNLNIEKIGSITIFMPPLSEQHRIAAYLDAKCAEIDAIIARKQELLDKLAAYKKSLIFECVTGKREVAA